MRAFLATVIPGWSEGPDPESRDSGFDASHHPGMTVQSNRLDTDSSAAVRLIASAIRGAIESVRMLAALVTASVGRIESVMTSSFSREPAMRAAAPPDSTPWEI